VDNQFSLIDKTDLVFIDPVSTGYSRPAEGQKAREFHGFKKDIESVGDFIRLYTPATDAGPRPNSWQARAMALPGQPASQATCKSAMDCS